jgi:hypothetical protein
MELSLKNYKRILPADLIKKATQNKVRECDELKKGHFQAYVDEKAQTFDTFLMLNSEGKVTNHGCDYLNFLIDIYAG